MATSQPSRSVVKRKPATRLRRAPQAPVPSAISAPVAKAAQQRPSREEFVRQRAYEIYLERGCNSNDDLGDWLQAEREYWYQWGRD